MIAHHGEAAPPRARPLKMDGIGWHASVDISPCHETIFRHSSAQAETVDAAEAADAGSGLHDVLAENYVQLHRRLTRHLGCPDLASDSLHDTWLRLAGKAPAHAVQNPQAYLYRAACNAAMDRLDVQKRHQGEADFELQMEVMADAAPGPAAIAEACSDLRALERVSERLPRLHQAILFALRIDQRPRNEVAQQYGISLRRVDRALAQALAFCAEQMGLHNQC